MAKQRKRDADDAPELGREWFTGAERIADGPEALRDYIGKPRTERATGEATVHGAQGNSHSRMSPDELGVTAEQLANASDPVEADRVRRRLSRGFYRSSTGKGKARLD